MRAFFVLLSFILFDMNKIKEAGYSLETPVLVTNYADLKEVKNTNASSVQLQETLIEVKY